MNDTKTKQPAEQGRPERRRNKSGPLLVSYKNRVLRHSELTQLFLDLDRAVDAMDLETHIYVTPAGYALWAYPAAHFEDVAGEELWSYVCRRGGQMVENVVIDMELRLRLPDGWPGQFARLFPPKYREAWDTVKFPMEPFGLRIEGTAVTLYPSGPAVVLCNQLFYSRDSPHLPLSVGQVARAAGFRDVDSIREEYEKATDQAFFAWLSDERWAEVASALVDIEPS
jgi:hypothetical protein